MGDRDQEEEGGKKTTMPALPPTLTQPTISDTIIFKLTIYVALALRSIGIDVVTFNIRPSHSSLTSPHTQNDATRACGRVIAFPLSTLC